jgi:hypothetical protein
MAHVQKEDILLTYFYPKHSARQEVGSSVFCHFGWFFNLMYILVWMIRTCYSQRAHRAEVENIKMGHYINLTHVSGLVHKREDGVLH